MNPSETREDFYPSRVGGRAALQDRLDPVVWGKGSRPFTKRQLERFESQGYLFLPSLFNQTEVDWFLKELDCLKEAESLREHPAIIREPGSGIIRSVFNAHRLSQMYAALSRDKRLADRAAQLLGSQVYIHQSRVNLKPAYSGKEFYWHSDFETWHVEDGMPRMRAVSCSIALTDNTEFNGPLMVMPGSHKRFAACAGDTPDEHYKQSLRRQEYGVPEPEMLDQFAQEGGLAAPKGKAGSVVFFDCNLMHGSNSNITPFSRSNVFLVFNSVENALGEPFGGVKPRPEFVASRDFTPVKPEAPSYPLFLKGKLQ